VIVLAAFLRHGLRRIDENQMISNVWTPSFYGYDGGGNVRNLTSSTGTVTDSYEYDAFGNKVNSTGTTPNNYLYRGEQYDPDLGLYYLRARYYNPVTGRFMSRDPEDGVDTDPATLHKYLYAGGDPINHLDPSGRAVTVETALVLGTISLSAVAALPPVAARVSCILFTAAEALEAAVGAPFGYSVTSMVPDVATCQVQVTYQSVSAITPPRPGGKPDTCSYYDDRCKTGDTYSCNAAQCCRDFGDTPANDATRECLMTYDYHECKNGDAICRTREHFYCYLKNGRVPYWNIKVPPSCYKTFTSH
jgi:RHS repeat-associated protein